jgi:hypothetical protein
LKGKKKERNEGRTRESRNYPQQKTRKRKMRDDEAIHKKYDVLAVTEFIKTHPMKTGVGVDCVN